MRLAPKNIAIVFLAGFTLFALGCSSNNKGKIEGKWKLVTGKGIEEQKAMMDLMKAYVFVEFKADNSVTFGVESSDPEMQKALAGEKTTFTGKYKLLSGDKVEFTDMPKQDGKGMFGGKDRAQANVKIDGDNMTMTDAEGTFTLTKVK